MSADPFSDILHLTDAQPTVSGGFVAGGAWALRFPSPDKIKFFALVKGSCWLSIEGEPEPVHVEEGDVFLLCAQRSFVLASDLETPPLDAPLVFSGANRRHAKLGESEDCIQIGGHVRLDPTRGALLADVLPPLICVRSGSQQATILRWLLDQLVREQELNLPGAGVASAQLAHLLFVQVLRAHLLASDDQEVGLLRVISDERIAPALRLMHAEPGHAWQLEELARAAAMSRTSFALHFKSVAGVAPLAYLTQWRMRLAERALREENLSVAELAQSLGYTSESAFSNAFKRVTGYAPRRYRTAFKTQAALNF